MDGVLYLNVGNKHLCHLAVSLYALRTHYDGVIGVLSGDDWFERVFADERLHPLHVIPFEYEGRNSYYSKTLMGSRSPFERTVFIDADTLPVAPFPELWVDGEEVRWTQFARWTTMDRKISGRLTRDKWREVFPEAVAEQLAQPYPAINTGVLGFGKQSQRIMDLWFKKTDEHERRKQAKRATFMVDEICAQLLAFREPHRILPDKFNASPVYSKNEDVRIWHGHGFKFLKRRGREPEAKWRSRTSLWLGWLRRAIDDRWCDIDQWWDDPTVAGNKRPTAFVDREVCVAR